MNMVYSVRQLSEHIRVTLSGSFPYVWVRGEVTNLSRPASGHVYFSLKDQDAMLNCVWFARAQRPQEHFDPMTGEVFENGPRPSLARSLANGQEIICGGSIGLYAPRGQYQLIVDLAQPAGQGELAARFEALRQKLGALGYFSAERKRPLPSNPTRVALITAPTGAVIRDFCTLASTRGCGAEFRLYPVPVQGEGAAPAICQAFAAANAADWAQVIVLMRGGGSLEDLWAFNEESVAGAVFHSRIPVLAAIGHEGDVSLADMTADVRASTPSHAAPLLWEDRDDLVQRVDACENFLRDALERHFTRHAQGVERLSRALRWLSPAQVLERLAERFAGRQEKLMRAGQRFVAAPAARLQALEQRVQQAALRRQDAAEHRFAHADVRLRALSPLAPLHRGYALVHDADGQLLSSVARARTGDSLRVQLRDGNIDVAVSGVHPQQKEEI